MTTRSTEPLPVLRVAPDDLPERIVVVGDPDRAERIAHTLDGFEELGRYREYVTFRGNHRGTNIGITSHGVGAGGAAICFEELCRGGAQAIVRVGTAGGLQPHILDGHHVVVVGAVRDDGVTERLVPLSFPALAARRVTDALMTAAADSAHEVHEGITLTGAIMYPLDVLGSNLELWQRAGAASVEQECAPLFVIAALHGIEAGSILTIDGNPLVERDVEMSGYDPHRQLVHDAVDAAALIALDALSALEVPPRD